MFTKLDKPHIYFIGQNSHGSDESWRFRERFIHHIQSNKKSIILIECPTVDLLTYTLRRHMNKKIEGNTSLKFSLYWWMRSKEFSDFLNKINCSYDISGIDLPLKTDLHEKHIELIKEINFPGKDTFVNLMKIDLQSSLSIAEATAEQRERVMTDKIKDVIKLGYKTIVVICHNFHATYHSWLHYPSLCQLVASELRDTIYITSYGIFSEKMTFLATPDGHSLSINTVYQACKAAKNRHSYYVKMISSLYRSEAQDALEITLNTPYHFDKIKIFPEGKPLTIGLN